MIPEQLDGKSSLKKHPRICPYQLWLDSSQKNHDPQNLLWGFLYKNRWVFFPLPCLMTKKKKRQGRPIIPLCDAKAEKLCCQWWYSSRLRILEPRPSDGRSDRWSGGGSKYANRGSRRRLPNHRFFGLPCLVVEATTKMIVHFLGGISRWWEVLSQVE